ncbi:MAG: NUDIX domain-containing protein [Patescibacteria group bacterium]
MQIINKAVIGSRSCIIEYNDTDDFSSLPYDLCTQVYGVCFYEDKIIVVHEGKRDIWMLAGGSIESGETYEQTLRREVQEESNMEIITWTPLGWQKIVYNDNGEAVIQLRAVCRVKPLGEFIKDPAGTVDKMELINPDDYRKYFDWGDIGEWIINSAKQKVNLI